MGPRRDYCHDDMDIIHPHPRRSSTKFIQTDERIDSSAHVRLPHLRAPRPALAFAFGSPRPACPRTFTSDPHCLRPPPCTSLDLLCSPSATPSTPLPDFLPAFSRAFRRPFPAILEPLRSISGCVLRTLEATEIRPVKEEVEEEAVFRKSKISEVG